MASDATEDSDEFLGQSSRDGEDDDAEEDVGGAERVADGGGGVGEDVAG